MMEQRSAVWFFQTGISLWSVPVDERRGVERDAPDVERVTRKMGVKRQGRGFAGLGKVAWRKISKESLFSAKVEQERAFCRTSDLRASLLCQFGGWTIRQARRRKLKCMRPKLLTFPWIGLMICGRADWLLLEVELPSSVSLLRRQVRLSSPCFLLVFQRDRTHSCFSVMLGLPLAARVAREHIRKISGLGKNSNCSLHVLPVSSHTGRTLGIICNSGGGKGLQG